MAASMVRGPASRRLCLPQILRKSQERFRPNPSYFVLVPDVPTDTNETNSLLRTNDYPQFTIAPGRVVTGTAKVALDCDLALGSHLKNIEAKGKCDTFEELFNPIEEAVVPVNYALNTSKQIALSLGGEKYNLVYSRNFTQTQKVLNDRWKSETLFKSVKELNKNREKFTGFQQRLIDHYIQNAEDNGLGLPVNKRDRFFGKVEQIQKFSDKFVENVELAYRMYLHKVVQDTYVKDIPRQYLQLMVPEGANPHRGPWNITLHPQVYYAVMKYSPYGILRRDVWEKYNGQAGEEFLERHVDNIHVINKLRNYRREIAQMMGYKNFAELVLQGRMAGNVENVLNLLEMMRTTLHDKASNDLEVLQEFADKEMKYNKKLEHWDVEYIRYKRQALLFPVDHNEVAQYFPLEKVMNFLFTLSKKLFGITFKECQDCDIWSSDVKVYNVFEEDGNIAGTVYFDPYARSNKAHSSYASMGRDRSDLLNATPISYLSLILPKPLLASQPTLLTFEDLEKLFFHFGTSLQQVMTKVPYSEISGTNQLELDARDICPNVMKGFLNVPSIMKSMSSHHATGEQIPDNLITNLMKAKNHMNAVELIREVYLSALDMEINIAEGIWYPRMKHIWEMYMPMPLHEDDYHLCHMTNIMIDDYVSGYYSRIWSQMIAADIMSTFEDAGFGNEEKQAAVGRRFRDTYLTQGGGLEPGEVFRRFQGRDPSVKAYQKIISE